MAVLGEMALTEGGIAVSKEPPQVGKNGPVCLISYAALPAHLQGYPFTFSYTPRASITFKREEKKSKAKVNAALTQCIPRLEYSWILVAFNSIPPCLPTRRAASTPRRGPLPGAHLTGACTAGKKECIAA